MWSRAKSWVVDTCWNMFSMEKMKQRSQLFAIVLGITLLLTIISLIAIAVTYVEMHVWRSNSEYVLVPREKLVTIDGNMYIPIQLV